MIWRVSFTCLAKLEFTCITASLPERANRKPRAWAMKFHNCFTCGRTIAGRGALRDFSSDAAV